MPADDFRSVRLKLPPEVFAISEGIDEPPTDLIPQETWNSIIHLPDDVSLRTSDHYGTCLRNVWDFWGNWVTLVLDLQGPNEELAESPIARVALDSAAYFQAAVHNAVVGYYRLAFASLRGVVENMTVGLYFDLSSDGSKFTSWLAGDEFSFGWAADQLRQNAVVSQLERELDAAVRDDLFGQRNTAAGSEGGLARALFRELSKYAHGAPNYTDADLWASNGPVFVHAVFETWMQMFALVFAFGLLEIRIARPDVVTMGDDGRGLKESFMGAVSILVSGSDERRILEAAGSLLWRTP